MVQARLVGSGLWRLIMNLIIRQGGSRRVGLPVEFPLTDSRGLFVVNDRRRLPNRRKAKQGIDDLRVILSKMARN